MSSEEPVRSVPDELFQQVTAKPGRQLPDALFGPAPARTPRAEREEPIRSVPDELFKQVTARTVRSLPDALFGPMPAPVPAEPEQDEAADSATGAGASDAAIVESGDDTPGSADGIDSVAAESTDDLVDTVEQTVSESVATSETSEADSTASGIGQGGTELEPSAPETSDVAAEVVSVDVLDDAGDGIAAAAEVAADGSEVAVVESETGDVAAAARADGPEIAATETASSEDAASENVTEAGESAAAQVGVVENLVVAPAAAVDGATESAVPQPEPSAPQDTDGVLVESAPAALPVAEASPRPVLLVIADSLAYYGPKGGLPADDPRIWPNLVAAELDWDVELIARIGWTCRDAYWALIGDPRVWAAVPRAGAVVFAVGGMDTLPSPLPTALRELIRYIRPPRLRRGVRSTYNWLQPKLSKLGRPVALPPRVSVDYLEQSREALTHLRPELPVVAVLPSVHKCEAYGRVHRGRAKAVKALRAWSGRTSVPLVDLGEAVREDIESGSANPDGIHWGWAGHTAVATAMTKALQEVR